MSDSIHTEIPLVSYSNSNRIVPFKQALYNKLGRDCSPRPLQIGLELEYQIIRSVDSSPDENIIQNLFSYMVKFHGFSYIHDYEICNSTTNDKLTVDYSSNNLELIIEKSENLILINSRVITLINVVKEYLELVGHNLLESGSNPFHWSNQCKAIENPKYKLIEKMLELYHPSSSKGHSGFCSQISSSQVHIDLYKHDAVRIFNVLEVIDRVKYLLFANSPIVGGRNYSKITLCARDYFWRNSAFGILRANVGVRGTEYSSIEEIIDYESEKAMFRVERNNKNIFFKPISVRDFYASKKIQGIYINKGRLFPISISPLQGDLKIFRPYNNYIFTNYGTVEIRSECAQPISDVILPAAFNLGIIESGITAEELRVKLKRNSFELLFLEFNKQIGIREMSCALKNCLHEIISIAEYGLKKRNLGEEHLLSALFNRVDSGTNPAMNQITYNNEKHHI